jgi:hypothetical protein
LESEHETSQRTSAGDQEDTSRESDNEDEDSEHESAADGAWKRFAAARYAEVQAQIDFVTRAHDDCQKRNKSLRKHAPPTGDLSGKWLLYGKQHVAETSDHYHMQLRQTTQKKHAEEHPGSQQYSGELTIGPSGRSKTFKICALSPAPRVTGVPITLHLKWSRGRVHEGNVVFWGNGKMLVTLPSSVLEVPGRNSARYRFAGLLSNHVVTDPKANARDGEYDRIIRTEPSSSAAVKIEKEDSYVDLNDDYQSPTAVALKPEDSGSSNSGDEWVDDMATTIDTVQKQESLVNQGLIVPLHEIGGEWHFHSPRHYLGLDGRISLSFGIRQDHDIPDQMCAPGHCKSIPGHPKRVRQNYYCGQLRLKAEEGRPDLDCLIRQFDVPEYTSPSHITILLNEPRSHDTICMHTWFFGDGTMRIELPTSMIRSYRGQDDWILFSGLKSGWRRDA